MEKFFFLIYVLPITIPIFYPIIVEKKKMKILYLHGLDAKPSKEKIDYLEEIGHNVVAPHLDYKSYIDDISLFNMLSFKIKDEGINFLIGSSFGGYMCFWLSELHKIQSVLFNPALMMQSESVPVIKEYSNTRKTFILGEYDDIVDPEGTKRFIEKNNISNYEMIVGDHGHRTSLEVFQWCKDYIK